MRRAVSRCFVPVLVAAVMLPLVLTGCEGGEVETTDVGIKVSTACQFVLINGDGSVSPPCEGDVVDYYSRMTPKEIVRIIATGQVTITVPITDTVAQP